MRWAFSIPVLVLAAWFLKPVNDWWSFWSDNRDTLNSLFLALGGLVLIWREAIAHRQANTAADRHQSQTEADRERRITDSFTKAVELLGNGKLEVRLGAIYALERIARDSKRDYWPIMEILAAYVRNRSKIRIITKRLEFPEHQSTEIRKVNGKIFYKSKPPTIPIDVQTVLTVIGRRELNHENWGQTLDLSHIDLSNADLSKANLTEINLAGSILDGANLTNVILVKSCLMNAKLINADLSKADLTKAKLNNADLSNARLTGANLTGAKLIKTILIGITLIRANLSEADMTDANLTEATLNEANLTRAMLVRANLTRAKLYDADLSATNLHEAELYRANLTRAKIDGVYTGDIKFCRTKMPDGSIKNRDCSPEDEETAESTKQHGY